MAKKKPIYTPLLFDISEITSNRDGIIVPSLEQNTKKYLYASSYLSGLTRFDLLELKEELTDILINITKNTIESPRIVSTATKLEIKNLETSLRRIEKILKVKKIK